MTKSKVLVRIALALVCVQLFMIFLPTIGYKYMSSYSGSYYSDPYSVYALVAASSNEMHEFSMDEIDEIEELDGMLQMLSCVVVVGGAIVLAIIAAVMSTGFKSSVLQMILVVLASMWASSTTLWSYVGMLLINMQSGSNDTTIYILPEGFLHIAITLIPLIMLPIVILVAKKEKRAALSEKE